MKFKLKWQMADSLYLKPRRHSQPIQKRNDEVKIAKQITHFMWLIKKA